MKNFRKSRKALSPVVASIILIAVTVAVSIAVAAWMGGMSVNFMNTEQLTITNAQFVAGTPGTATLTVRNTGATDIIIQSAVVNGVDATVTGAADPIVVPKNSEVNTIVVGADYASGGTYQIRLLSAKGTWFPYNAVCP